MNERGLLIKALERAEAAEAKLTEAEKMYAAIRKWQGTVPGEGGYMDLAHAEDAVVAAANDWETAR